MSVTHELSAGTRAPDPLIGRVVADRYRIVGHVGRGGMGVVYKVEHLRIGKLMAMKLLTGELSRNRDVVRRFKREALAASRLTNINTVQVWDFGHSDGLTYLVMELVHGEDLGKVLRATGPLPWPRVASIAVQTCNSLVEAHSRGIVHRDLKPENLLIVHAEARELQDVVKVLDFGLAKLHEDERPHMNDITTSGAIVGTPFYMSPEQIRGEPVDGRADIYALGAVMYRALTGTPPFTAPTPMAVLTQHLTEPVVPPEQRAPDRGIPPEASAIVMRALSKNAADRQASATVLRNELVESLVRVGVSDGFLRSGELERVANAIEGRVSQTPDARRRPGKTATRGEVHAYSRTLHKRGLVALGIAAGLVIFAAVVARIARTGSDAMPAVAGMEIEPNDTFASANILTLGTAIRGFLGKRSGPDQADSDIYQIDVPGLAVDHPLVQVDLTPLPNIPLCLELLSGETHALLRTFCQPRDRAIHISAYAMAPGRNYLRVSQDRHGEPSGDIPPAYENVSDTYSLRAASIPRTSDLEIEPNETMDTAETIAVGQVVHGSLAWKGDEDVYCAQGAEGVTARFIVSLQATPGRHEPSALEVNVFGLDGPAHRDGALGAWMTPAFTLDQKARCIRIARPVLRDGDEAYTVSVERTERIAR